MDNTKLILKNKYKIKSKNVYFDRNKKIIYGNKRKLLYDKKIYMNLLDTLKFDVNKEIIKSKNQLIKDKE